MSDTTSRQPSLLSLPTGRKPRRVNAIVSIPVAEGVRPMSYRPTADLHRKLLLHAMESGTSMQKVIDTSLTEYFARIGGRP